MQIQIDENKMIQIITITDNNGDDLDLEIPFKWVVCSRCEGKGKHTNPSVDGHGITQDEWANEWSLDEQEAYMAGAYDVSCHKCSGKRVVPEIDETKYEKDNPELYNKYLDYCRQEAIYRRQIESEINYGC